MGVSVQTRSKGGPEFENCLDGVLAHHNILRPCRPGPVSHIAHQTCVVEPHAHSGAHLRTPSSQQASPVSRFTISFCKELQDELEAGFLARSSLMTFGRAAFSEGCRLRGWAASCNLQGWFPDGAALAKCSNPRLCCSPGCSQTAAPNPKQPQIAIGCFSLSDRRGQHPEAPLLAAATQDCNPVA